MQWACLTRGSIFFYLLPYATAIVCGNTFSKPFATWQNFVGLFPLIAYWHSLQCREILFVCHIALEEYIKLLIPLSYHVSTEYHNRLYLVFEKSKNKPNLSSVWHCVSCQVRCSWLGWGACWFWKPYWNISVERRVVESMGVGYRMIRYLSGALKIKSWRGGPRISKDRSHSIDRYRSRWKVMYCITCKTKYRF